MGQRAGRKYRLKRRKDVARLFEEGRRASDGLVTLYAVENPGWEHARMAVGVSRKSGSAVVRNRIKRLCREALRLARSDLPAGWDFMVVPRPEVDLTVEKLKVSIEALAGRLTKERPKRDKRE